MQPVCALSAIPGEIRRAGLIAGEGADAVIGCAARALYEATAHGRCRTVVA